MKRKLLTLSLILVGSWLFAATAQATTCGGIEFTLVAKDNLGMGEGASTINGNVLVTSATGTATIGPSTTINGKLFAANIFMAINTTVTECHGTVTGPGAGGCGTVFAFDPPAACIAVFPPPPLVVPVADPCVNLASSLNQTFTGPGPHNLPSGCYKALRLNAGAVLNLTGPGAYTFLSIRLLNGAVLQGSPEGTIRTVNVNTNITTDPNTSWTDLLVNVAGTQGALTLANNTTLTNTTINSAFRNIHARTGTELICSELIADTLTIEPITTRCDTPPEFIVCVCPPGTQFPDPDPNVCDLTSCGTTTIPGARTCERCGGADEPACRE